MKKNLIYLWIVGLILTIIISGCGGGGNPGVTMTPTPTVSGSTPTPLVSDSTPTPTVSGLTPAPTVSSSTPTPTVSGSTPSPTVSVSTPSPTVSSSTPTPTVSPTPTPYEFNCNFDSYSPANPWALPTGWWSNTSSAWAIVPGYSGNGVKYITTTPNTLTFLTCPYNNSIQGDNYTVSVKVRLTDIIAGNFGICARFNNYSCYGLILSEIIGSTETSLAITKFNNWTDYQLNNKIFLNSYLNAGTFYTLTLQISGTNPVQINGSVTDGVNTQSVTFTDDGSTPYGAPHSSGKAGVYVYCGSSNVPVIFDDFKVTVP